MPHQLRSPWLEHIDRARPVNALDGDYWADVAVVGAGIAGVTTAYYLLTQTKKNVILIEADKVAHGATGHNAGQLVSYFERPFHDIVNEFGLDLATDGQRLVEAAWDQLDEIRRDMKLATPCLSFTGYAGCRDIGEIVSHLQDNAHKAQAGLHNETMLIADDWEGIKKIPKAYKKHYTLVPHKQILSHLESKDRSYVGMLASKKGCMNSARFTEELATALLTRYADRFVLAEHTPVKHIALFKRHAILTADHATVTAKKVILCTNGFERLHIENRAGANIDVKYHHLVRGIVGYMTAFIEEPFAPPAAISYLPTGSDVSNSAYDSDPYFYFTRRPHVGQHEGRNLVCIAGPETSMDDTKSYSRTHPYPAEAKKVLADFMKRTYRHAGRSIRYQYFWHGLMGYTPNGLRCVGAEPCNPVLMYNLGCNGVGILPSLAGSKRIAQIIRRKKLAPSIFDPADQRCMIPEKVSVPALPVASPKWFAQHTVVAFSTFWIVTTVLLLLAYAIVGVNPLTATAPGISA